MYALEPMAHAMMRRFLVERDGHLYERSTGIPLPERARHGHMMVFIEDWFFLDQEIWFYHHGFCAGQQITHRNGDALDCRIDNLTLTKYPMREPVGRMVRGGFRLIQGGACQGA